MSNPFRGSDSAADLIDTRNFADFRTFMQERMATLLEDFAEMDRIVEAGDEALFEERFGHLRRPRPNPDGECVLVPEVTAKVSLCGMCQKMFVESIQMTESWSPSLHERYAHYATLDELHSAASVGCPLCTILWTHIAADYCIKFDPELSYTELWNIRSPKFSFDFISYSVSTSSEDGSVNYVLNFVYGGNSSSNYDDVHTIRLALVPIEGRIMLLCEPVSGLY